jgi:hypothetical protein
VVIILNYFKSYKVEGKGVPLHTTTRNLIPASAKTISLHHSTQKDSETHSICCTMGTECALPGELCDRVAKAITKLRLQSAATKNAWSITPVCHNFVAHNNYTINKTYYKNIPCEKQFLCHKRNDDM